MGEASDELIEKYPEIAEKVRIERLALMDSLNSNLSFETGEDDLAEFRLPEIYEVPFEELITDICITHIQETNSASDKT